MARFIGDSDKMQLDDIDDEESGQNLCVICKVDMGSNNPRQLCRKTYCENEEPVKLCENMDCVRYPPDWDAEKDTEETYQEDPWLKCNQCDGYYNNDGGGDILYVQEEPNNQEAECSLCGKTKDIVQMKGSGQYLCGNACDESDEEEEEEEEEEEGKRKCETCAIKINTDDIIELSIEVNGHNLKLCLCENCFQDKADTLRKEGWNVDDFFEKEEEDNDDVCDTPLKTPTIVTQDDTEYHVYNLQNAYKKTIYSTEEWSTNLKDGKCVQYEITTHFYWGSCEVELTNKDKDDLLKMNEIILNSIPGCSMDELDSGCDVEGTVVDEDNYTEEEKKEIHRLLYFDEDNKESYDPECDDDVDVCILEANDWSMDDTIYGIDTGGCTLELISD
jgi:hypothetical protein